MRPLSPIEMMVDKACGVDVAACHPSRPVAAELDEAAKALLAVADCAVAWRKETIGSLGQTHIDMELMKAVKQWMKFTGEK